MKKLKILTERILYRDERPGYKSECAVLLNVIAMPGALAAGIIVGMIASLVPIFTF